MPLTEDERRKLELLVQRREGYAVMLLDPSGQIETWLPSAREVFGYAAEEVLGRPADVLFTPEDVARGIPDLEVAIATANGSADNDRWLLRKDGARFWAMGMLLPIHNNDGDLLGFAKILRNQTSLKTELETWKNRSQHAETVNERQKVMVSQLAHELRNVLSPLQSAGDLLQAMQLGTEATFVSQIIQRQVDFMSRLVNDLMDAARIETGKVQLQLTEIELSQLLAESVEVCQQQIQDGRHDLQLLLPQTVIRVRGDWDRLEQVFVNLITNACKYTQPGGRIWVKATVEDADAVVRVEDTGIGISPETLPKIFGLFTQDQSAREQSPGGLGIGLALVKSLVDLHGGQVMATSDGKDRGSEFTVRLPLATDSTLNTAGNPGDP
jgi:two-component system CheB/CheR fusion protein